MIGEEHIAFATGGIPVSDAPQGNRAFQGFRPGEPDGLVREQSLSFIDGAALHHLVGRVTLLAGDEEDFLAGKVPEPGIIGVAQIFHHNGAFGEAQGTGLLDVRLPGWRNGDKSRQIAVMVQQGVQLEAGLGAAESSPGKERQAKAHHGGVQAVELIFELELVFRGQGLTTPVHHAEQGLEKRGGAPVVGIGKGGTSHRLYSQVVETLDASFQAGDAVPQTHSGRELHEE